MNIKKILEFFKTLYKYLFIYDVLKLMVVHLSI